MVETFGWLRYLFCHVQKKTSEQAPCTCVLHIASLKIMANLQTLLMSKDQLKKNYCLLILGIVIFKHKTPLIICNQYGNLSLRLPETVERSGSRVMSSWVSLIPIKRKKLKTMEVNNKVTLTSSQGNVNEGFHHGWIFYYSKLKDAGTHK